MHLSESTIQAIWDRATIVEGHDPHMFRRDMCGAWIERDHYDNEDSTMGWEILELDGQLEPLHWQNRASSKLAGKLVCRVTQSIEPHS